MALQSLAHRGFLLLSLTSFKGARRDLYLHDRAGPRKVTGSRPSAKLSPDVGNFLAAEIPRAAFAQVLPV